MAVRVLDSGPGIDEASVERAFELFYRDPTLARVDRRLRDRAVRLRQPRQGDGRDDLGQAPTGRRLGVRVHPPGHPDDDEPALTTAEPGDRLSRARSRGPAG